MGKFVVALSPTSVTSKSATARDMWISCLLVKNNLCLGINYDVHVYAFDVFRHIYRITFETIFDHSRQIHNKPSHWPMTSLQGCESME